MSNDRRKSLINVIIANIEENRNDWVKALFYSDKDVSKIMERLLSEWTRNNMRGEPLEYATIEELEILAEKAEHYRDTPQEAFLRAMLRKSTNTEGQNEKS
ncbi:MAG: hypothetical protein RQ885_13200 [Desulfurococcales archaeon]|nr:hypothetical protein [Desulfurococcales archaeon]